MKVSVGVEKCVFPSVNITAEFVVCLENNFPKKHPSQKRSITININHWYIVIELGWGFLSYLYSSEK